jgi:hypothetical protein
MDLAQLLDELDRATPGFRSYFDSDDEHYYSRDSVHSAFLVCSDFVQENPPAPETWERLASLVNQIVGGKDDELHNAVCSCFLESLASPSHPIRPLLGRKALAFWKQCEAGQ